MPTNRHLTLAEIRDFAPGLWEGADWLMPASGAQEMVDCYPQEGGGLRAFFKGTDLPNTGIADPTNERVIGVYSRGGISVRSGAAGNTHDRYMMTYRQAVGATRPRLYRLDETNGETSWTQIFVTSGATEFATATSDNNFPHKAVFEFFRLSTGSPNDAYVLVSMQYVSATPGGTGFYRLNYNDLSSVQKLIELVTLVTGADRPTGPLVVHQARVMIGGLATGDAIIWSDPGTVTFGAASYLQVEPNKDGPGFVAMHAIAPSDLLILKEGAPMVTVQGDITNPTVQQMVEGVLPGGSGKQDFGRTPYGLTYIANDGGVYLTNGSTVECLSNQLGSFSQQADFVGLGDTNYLNDFLFCPKGYVYDWRTKSWFKQTRLAGAVNHVETQSRTIWGPVGTGTSPTLRSINPFPVSTRMNTYSWKSAPLRSPDGRQLEIREVELIVKTYDANAQIAVTVGGVPVTKTITTAGRQNVSFLFKARDMVLDTRVVSSAGSSANEAPSIEAVRVYSRAGHQTS